MVVSTIPETSLSSESIQLTQQEQNNLKRLLADGVSLNSFTEKEQERLKAGLPPWESLSFACGGWLQFYMFGVAKALQSCQLVDGVRYYGCSAGSLTATGLVYGGEFDEAIRFCKEQCLPRAWGEWFGLFQLHDYVSSCIKEVVFPMIKDTPSTANDRLFISITSLPSLSSKRINKFNSKEILLKSLLASCAAVPFARLVKITDADHEGWYVDGGLSDFQPIENDETITVTPLYFQEGSSIKPSRYVPLWWSFLPPRESETVDWLYHLGFKDTLSYLQSRGLKIDEGLLERFESAHPYNSLRGKVSVNRFLGYDMKSFRFGVILSLLGDGILLFWVLFVWKPIALILIYFELFFRIFRILVLTSWKAFFPTWVLSLVRGIIVKSTGETGWIDGLGEVLLSKGEGLVEETGEVLRELWECVSCVASLSLFLRFLSGTPSGKELKKHKRLAKHSVIYRLCRHFIC